MTPKRLLAKTLQQPDPLDRMTSAGARLAAVSCSPALQSREFQSKLPAPPEMNGSIIAADMPRDELLARLWWDRIYGERLQRANSEGARTAIINEARKELAVLLGGESSLPNR